MKPLQLDIYLEPADGALLEELALHTRRSSGVRLISLAITGRQVQLQSGLASWMPGPSLLGSGVASREEGIRKRLQIPVYHPLYQDLCDSVFPPAQLFLGWCRLGLWSERRLLQGESMQFLGSQDSGATLTSLVAEVRSMQPAVEGTETESVSGTNQEDRMEAELTDQQGTVVAETSEIESTLSQSREAMRRSLSNYRKPAKRGS